MATSSKKWILKSSDGQMFEVDEAEASESGTIKHILEDFIDGDSVTLPNVKGNILTKVIEYCKKHVETPSDADADANARTELKKFDTEFVKLDPISLIDLALVANYLNITGLLGLACQAIADNIQDMKPEKLRKFFNIENNFTKEEEEALKKENAWAYDLLRWLEVAIFEFSNFQILIEGRSI